jgi:hypothetical protein
MTMIADRPDVQMFLTFLNNLPGPKMHELSPKHARRWLRWGLLRKPKPGR